MTTTVAHSPHTERHLAPGDSAIKQIRHSLLRSPSRGPTFRLFTSRHSSPSHSPQSENFPSGTPTTLFPVSAKKRKQILRHASPLRVSKDPLSAQRNPSRRILQDSFDQGNAGYHAITSTSPTEMQITMDENMLLPQSGLGRREKPTYYDLPKSSPLKRSEADFDMALAPSPSAKRRSVHGSIFAQDFGSPERKNFLDEQEEESSALSLQHSPIPKHKSSLRRAFLSPRFDTVPAMKSRPSIGNIWDIQAAKVRNRLSLDFPIPDSNNDGPFSIDVSTQPPKEQTTLGKFTLPPRHPLSRTITQSSFGSDIAEDSPTHAPIRHLGNFNKSFSDFTRSLPIGAMRPPQIDGSMEDTTFATPAAFRLEKPHPAAFMSTGLISKRNRNLTSEQMNSVAGVSDMPDTPCKRPLAVVAPIAAPTPNINLLKARAARQSLQAFASPSTPFNPRKTISNAGPESGLFGESHNQDSSRNGSFAESIQDAPKSPVANFHSRNGTKFTHPPPTPSMRARILHAMNLESQGKKTEDDELATMDSKSIPIPEIKIAGVCGADESCLSSPSPGLRFRNVSTIPSFSRRDARGEMHRPSPLNTYSTPLMMETKSFLTASPVADILRIDTATPSNTNNLSVAGQSEKSFYVPRPSFNDSLTVNLPATPIAARDSLGKFSSFGVSVTPNHPSAPFNVDPSITSRFDKVEPLSSGEFSHVWRAYNFRTVAVREEESRRCNRGSTDADVWAVKKAKNKYIGPKDRLRRLQEAEILQKLGQAEHVIQYFDHWEYQDHLYIQTEYCEEGTLHNFLLRAGQRARLDDFRIWKIMLEMAKGIRHIHDSGFIHLDIKPANVLVTFEGVLKIGDFGMASIWPAPPGTEGEGDREYIGPEILKGQFDKPADVFAFGLMMLEIAANVMLPDNGTAWQRLRSGDMSDVPSLTSSSDLSEIVRDVSGNPIDSPVRGLETVIRRDSSSLGGFDFGFATDTPASDKSQRLGELGRPPSFMTDAEDSSALDKVVRWMISPEPSHRPTAHEILQIEGIRWVEARRRGGATIFEGSFGPADEVLNHDSEMMDV